MGTLDYLKDIYNLPGKTISWAIIEETTQSDDTQKLKPGLFNIPYILKRSPGLHHLQVGTLILYDVKTMFLLRRQTLEMAGKINLHHE